MQGELSDDEWCESFEYGAGTREYADCRQRIDRQRYVLPPYRLILPCAA
jgi:hypothetical protein